MRTSIHGQRWPRSNPADVCKSPRKVRNVTRRIFRRLFLAGHKTTHDVDTRVDVEGAVPKCKYVSNKSESEFLLVRLSTFGLVNVWSPA